MHLNLSPSRPPAAFGLLLLGLTLTASGNPALRFNLPATLPTTDPAALADAASVNAAARTDAPDPYPAATPKRVVAVTRRISPAVVRIDVAQAVYRDGKRGVQRGIGSGVIIDQDGRILTNYHVAGRAAEIYVTLASEERVPARLVGDDHWTDLAIIQMDADTLHRKDVSFASAELGDSSTLVVGQDVMAFGTPFGLARTVTGGHVSATERTLYPQRLDIDGYETGDFSNWIQMDAPINPGNSGGPLVDLNGKVVGINTRGGAQNLNFAVPIDTAKMVIAAIEKTATPASRGYVPRGDLGLELKPLQDLEAFYHLDVDQGVLVDSVDRLSPAEDAGVQSQDILLELNGQPTNVRFPEELAPVRKRDRGPAGGHGGFPHGEAGRRGRPPQGHDRRPARLLRRRARLPGLGLVRPPRHPPLRQPQPVRRRPRRLGDEQNPRQPRRQGRGRSRRRDPLGGRQARDHPGRVHPPVQRVGEDERPLDPPTNPTRPLGENHRPRNRPDRWNGSGGITHSKRMEPQMHTDSHR